MKNSTHLLTEDEKIELKKGMEVARENIISSIIIHRHDDEKIEPIY